MKTKRLRLSGQERNRAFDQYLKRQFASTCEIADAVQVHMRASDYRNARRHAHREGVRWIVAKLKREGRIK